jgi:hypothetical protein
MNATVKLSTEATTVSEVDDLVYFVFLKEFGDEEPGTIGFKEEGELFILGGPTSMPSPDGYNEIGKDLQDVPVRVLQAGESFTITLEDE